VGNVQHGKKVANKVLVQAPTPALAGFVRRFMVVEFSAACRDQHLPEAGAVAAFSFRSECRATGHGAIPPAAFTGLWETMRGHEHAAGHAVLLAMFTPLGAASFLRQPLDEFSGATADLTSILPLSAGLRRLGEEIAAAPGHGVRMNLLERFLLARIGSSAPDPLIAAAVAWLERDAGHARIDALTAHIGLSQSALERRFLRVVGLTPKKYALLVRFRRALALRPHAAGLTDVAHAAGYFDQSHFINHFRRVTGVSPAAWFRQAQAN
jgi:AraC-like DNA-binding protein